MWIISDGMFSTFVIRLISDIIFVGSRYIGGVTLLVIYGHQVKSDDDEFLSLAEECVDLLANRIASSGAIWPVDLFPFCESSFPPFPCFLQDLS